MLKVIVGGRVRQGATEDNELPALDELAREGARRMIAAALEAEVDDYLARHRGERDDESRALVVRNGKARERKLTVGRAR